MVVVDIDVRCSAESPSCRLRSKEEIRGCSHLAERNAELRQLAVTLSEKLRNADLENSKLRRSLDAARANVKHERERNVTLITTPRVGASSGHFVDAMRAGSRHTTEAMRAAAFHERFRTHAAAPTQATEVMAAVASKPVRTVTGGVYLL